MTLHQLRIFGVVSRHLNITKAAAELHISQPSVFQQMKSLEESCDVRLYRKVGRGIELTAAGQKLRAEAREILAKVETLQQEFAAKHGSPETETLLVGGSHVPSKSVLPLCLAAFKSKHPMVQIKLQTKTSRSIEKLILNDELEIAVITHPTNSSRLHYLPLSQEQVVLFVSAHHPLAGKKDLSLGEIAATPLIVHRGLRRGTGEFTLDILKRIEEQGCRPNILMECNSGDAVKAAVLKGAGMGILIQTHIENEIRSREVQLVKIPHGKDMRITSFAIYQKDKTLSDNAKQFLDLLKRSGSPSQVRVPRQARSLVLSQLSE